jgi:hypothetical protein
MPNDLALKLQATVEREAAQISRLTEADAAVKGSSPAWSKKEELGHLIDSAANNHVRFVRASLEPEFRGPTYQQNGWVDRHGYYDMPWDDIVEFWRRYNALLAAVVRRIPEDRLQTPCVIGDSAPVTLRFLIEDYVLHMQHHLDHILRRDNLTQYPGAALGV